MLAAKLHRICESDSVEEDQSRRTSVRSLVSISEMHGMPPDLPTLHPINSDELDPAAVLSAAHPESTSPPATVYLSPDDHPASEDAYTEV